MTEGPSNEFWGRLDEEPATAYSAFCCYRDMGIARSLRKAAKAFYVERDGHRRDTEGLPTGSQLSRFKEWSSRYMWRARVEAYDAEEAAERSCKLKERRIRSAEFHFNLAQLALQRCAERLQTMALEGEVVPLRTLPRMMDVAAQMQRLALGASTAAVDVRSTAEPRQEDKGDDERLRRLSLEDKEDLARIMGYLDEREWSYDLDGLGSGDE